MATWDELTLTSEAVQGIADPEFLDEDGNFDHGLLRAEIVDSAKRLVRMKVTKKLGPYILQKGGPTVFFDAVADIADEGEDLELLVNEMLVYAFLHQWSFAEHPAQYSRLLADSEYYMNRLNEAVDAFCAIAPALVLADGETKVKMTSTVVATSSPSYYGYDG